MATTTLFRCKHLAGKTRTCVRCRRGFRAQDKLSKPQPPSFWQLFELFSRTPPTLIKHVSITCVAYHKPAKLLSERPNSTDTVGYARHEMIQRAES